MFSYARYEDQHTKVKVPLSATINNSLWDIGQGLEYAEYIEAFSFSVVYPQSYSRVIV